MGSVHDTEALAFLNELAGIAAEPAGFRAALSQVLPGWQGNADLMMGYTDAASETQIKVAKAFFDVLPYPFNRGFDAKKDHGFGPTAVYVEDPARSAEDLKALIAAAVARASYIVNEHG